jgi:hypothetical protein
MVNGSRARCAVKRRYGKKSDGAVSQVPHLQETDYANSYLLSAISSVDFSVRFDNKSQ